MPIQSRTVPLFAASLGLLSCAPEGGFARAYQIQTLSETIGGPKAIARPGDYILENDRVRVAILGPRNSMGPHTSGASLIDADLQRPDPRYSQGRGLDLLAQAVSERLGDDIVQERIQLDYAEARLRAQFYAAGAVVGEQIGDDGRQQLEVRLQRSDFNRLLKREGWQPEQFLQQHTLQ